MGKIKLEVSTLGIDEALQGVSTDPFTTSGQPTYTGLRVPPVLSTSSKPSTQPRYLFNLANINFKDGLCLRGIRQGYTLGMDANEGVLPERPIELWAKTPTFRFVDGNISWHLVLERQTVKERIPSTDTQNWSYLRSDASAMLYQTFVNTNVDPNTGAPLFYMSGLTAYTPPDLTGQLESVAGLGNIHDLRFPWFNENAWFGFGDDGILIEGRGRLTLYASVLQTNPNNRGNPSLTMTNLSSGGMPEEAFIQDYTVSGGEEEPSLGPMYWRIMGALLIEKGEDS